MNTEFLIGGPCDGLEIKKTDSPIMYSGRFGIRLINVYERKEDGKLHFSYSMRPDEKPKA